MSSPQQQYKPDQNVEDWDAELRRYTATHHTGSTKYRVPKSTSYYGVPQQQASPGTDGVYGTPPGAVDAGPQGGSRVGIRVVPPNQGQPQGGGMYQPAYQGQNGHHDYSNGAQGGGYPGAQQHSPPPSNPPPPPSHQPRPAYANGPSQPSGSPPSRPSPSPPTRPSAPPTSRPSGSPPARGSPIHTRPQGSSHPNGANTGPPAVHPNAVHPNATHPSTQAELAKMGYGVYQNGSSPGDSPTPQSPPMRPQTRQNTQGSSPTELYSPRDGHESKESMNPNLQHTKSNVTVKSDLTSQFEQAFKTLENMEIDARTILDLDELQSDVKEHIRSVIDTIKEVKDILGSDKDDDDREDIPALLDWEHLDWKMSDTKEVTVFRARASKVVHENFLYKDYHFPRYYSCSPLPPQQHVVQCNVKLPPEMNKVLDKITIQITEHDTARSLIRAVFRKVENRLQEMPQVRSEDTYVLKALGSLEYMDGDDRVLFEYDHIRSNLRHNRLIQLVLVTRPQVNIEESYPTSALEYETLVENDTPILLPDDFPWYPVMEKEWQEMEYIPMREMHWPYRVRILGVDNLTPDVVPSYEGTHQQISLQTFLYYGDQIVPSSTWTTEGVFGTRSARWMQWLDHTNIDNGHEIYIDTLPRATRIGFFLYGNMGDDKDNKLLAWVLCNLVDENGLVEAGVKRMNMWAADDRQPGGDDIHKWLFRSTCRTNEVHKNGHPTTLSVEWDKYALPVVAPLYEELKVPDESIVGPLHPWKFIEKKKRTRLHEIWKKDPLYELSAEDKEMIWKYRHHLTKDSSILPKFLQSVDWMKQDYVHEAHRLLSSWVPPIAPGDFLELLDIKYHDYKVREYAVHFLRNIPDDELQLFLLQMTQILKFEPYHDSPLCRFLISRALANPYQIGHHLFWHCKAEIHSPDFSERYGVIIEEYLHHVGKHVMELRKQASCVTKLQRVSEMVATSKNKYKVPDEEIEKDYKRELERLNHKFFGPIKEGKFQMVLNPRVESTVMRIDKCRYMSSKKAPLWLVFNNADNEGPSNFMIFKSGDDLRQDILTLQLLKIMDKIWLSEGLDMRMLPYSCIATGVNSEGLGVGMIEVVLDSDTTSGIQLKYGGGAVGALKATPLDDYLKAHNKGTQYQKAQENFVHSCAGYCVATFILGIGDRHNGNIMLTKDGHLFHIDFGHFLGNFKSKMGFNRERSAFVFTPEMAYVMGGKKYKKHPLFKLFKDQCCKAFNALRKHGPLLINLFVLMISAGMPELLENKDVFYLHAKLYLEKSEKEAEKIFKKEISNALTTTYRQLDNMIHNWKHK